MKKVLFITFSLLIATATQAHHTVERSLFTDNWRFGIQGGALLPIAHAALCRQTCGIAGVRAERYLTPSYGLGLHLQVVSDNRSATAPAGSFARSSQLSLEHLVNLNNFICGYNGRPDIFELTLTAGLGWGHRWKHSSADESARDCFTSRVGLQFAVNPGETKAWYVYLEPAFTWRLTGQPNCTTPRFHRNHSSFGLSVGVSYRLKNHTGLRYFKPARLYDQVEVDALNAKINDLRRMLRIARKSSNVHGETPTHSAP
ncbi:MAG: hypothetical protein K2N13_06275 [Paraprevotella sp.]|nr:hypothetical protein [Paraprevotella sp.]